VVMSSGLAYGDVIASVKRETVSGGGVQRQRRVRDGQGGAAAGYIDERSTVLEILTSLRRAGADTIVTYHAKDAARWLAQGA